MSETPATNFIYLKGKIKSASQKLYGLFVVAFNTDGLVHSNQSMISSFSEIYDSDIDRSWDLVEDEIIQLKWKGKYNTNVSITIQAQFEKLNEDSFIRSQLFDALNEYDFTGVETILYDLLNRILQDKSIKIEIGIQEVTHNEIYAVKERRDRESKEKNQKDINTQGSHGIEQGSIVIDTSLILSPVKGKPLYDIRIGDKIMAKIEPKSDQANYFIDFYKLRKETRIMPIPGEVVDIKADSKDSPVEIIIKLDRGLYGKCIEEERQVKLRLYDPRIDGVMVQEKRKPFAGTAGTPAVSQNEGMSFFTFMLIGIFSILLILIIVILYIMI
ncbi:MAG: hypothetical protein JW982_10265 [Spirochaetes bacterium]|nr:hypothetical protein [Spirochaetota bacterium]